MTIFETRSKALLFSAYERLLLRINASSSKKLEIERDFENLKIGFTGELKVDHAIRETHFSGPFYVLPNVELKVSQHRFIEIDTLIATRSFICIFEVKNLKGSIKFNENPYSMHQTINGKTYSYPCPQQQANRAADSLQYWLQQQLHLNLPIQKAIVFPNPQTLIESPPTEVKMLSLREIPLFLQELDQQPNILTPQQLQLIIKNIKNEHSPFNDFPLAKKYDIPIQHLRTGIVCSCGGSGQRMSQRTWICNKCLKPIPKAIENALFDWFFLFKSNISNQECRKLLTIHSRTTATRILKNLIS